MIAPVDIREILPPLTGLAYRAMRELRPHVDSEEKFVGLVDGTQRGEGYRLFGAFAPGGDQSAALAVAGFRVVNTLAWGHALYVDDLSTHPEGRRRGYAGALMDRLAAEAAQLGCEQLHLDSGVGVDRQDAHRLYFNHGLRIVSHHFARGV
jgi:ribosomal protein S18 acetylase RimI-like enzyme